MDTIEEQWKVVEEFPDYEVSNLGRIRSNKDRTSPRILSLNRRRTGHLCVSMSHRGVRERRSVHRIVATAWVGPPQTGQVTRHLDGNPANNVSTNLAWGTYKENQEDSRQHGTLSIGSRNGKAKITEEIASLIKTSNKATVLLAKELGLARWAVQRIRSGRTWKHV